MTHIFTFLIGIASGMFLLANTKAIKMPIIVNSMTLNEQAMLVGALVVVVGLTVRGIARAKGSQRINKGGK